MGVWAVRAVNTSVEGQTQNESSIQAVGSYSSNMFMKTCQSGKLTLGGKGSKSIGLKWIHITFKVFLLQVYTLCTRITFIKICWFSFTDDPLFNLFLNDYFKNHYIFNLCSCIQQMCCIPISWWDDVCFEFTDRDNIIVVLQILSYAVAWLRRKGHLIDNAKHQKVYMTHDYSTHNSYLRWSSCSSSCWL